MRNRQNMLFLELKHEKYVKIVRTVCYSCTKFLWSSNLDQFSPFSVRDTTHFRRSACNQ
jgi:hypothetical protein